MITNFIICTEETIHSVFEDAWTILDPQPWDELVFTDASSLEELAALAGVFPSITRARKAGCKGPIPPGLEQIGTKKQRFWVWNPNPKSPLLVPKSQPFFIKTNRWLNTPW